MAAEFNSQTDEKVNSTSSSNSKSLNTDSSNKTALIKSETAPTVLTADTAIKPTVKKQDTAKKTESKWSLDLYASPDYSMARGEPNVKTKLSYTVGLRVNRSFGTHFSGRIGIQFSHTYYNLKDSSAYSSPYLMSIDLPLLAGYACRNETLGMSINAGLVFNLYSWLPEDQLIFLKRIRD